MIKIAYDIKDAWQAALGTIVATLFFFMLRAGDPILIDPTIGIIIGAVWIYITGKPFLNKNKSTKIHFIMNVIVATAVAATLALVFNVASWEQIWSFDFFGTAAWLGMLLGIKYAQFYDKMNVFNLYSTWYHKKR